MNNAQADREFRDRIVRMIGRFKQCEIAAALNTTPQAVNKWRKTGQIRREHLVQLAQLGGFSLEWVLTGNEESRSELPAKERRNLPLRSQLKHTIDQLPHGQLALLALFVKLLLNARADENKVPDRLTRPGR